MSENRMYESTYIITPELTNDDFVNIVEKFNRVLTDNKAEIINQERWGFRKLAYEINRKQSGYYVYTEFSAPGSIVEVLEREYSYDDRLIRYLTVHQDKDAAAYNLKRRTKIKDGKLVPAPTTAEQNAGRKPEKTELTEESDIEL